MHVVCLPVMAVYSRCFAARSGRRSHYPPVWQADMPPKQMVVADFEHELGDALGIRGGWW